MLNLTLLIAVRNGEDFLEVTLQKAAEIAKNTGCKVLVSDNHSIDKTKNIIQQYASFIESISPPEILGMAEHWTWATQQVQTKYVRLVGHDDILFEDNVLAQVGVLERKEFAIACYSDRDYLITNSRGREIVLKSRGKKDHSLKNQSALLRSVLTTGTNGVGEPFCVTFRTRIFQDSSRPIKWSSRDPIYELETYFHALEFGEFVYCPGKSGLYRVHSHSYSSKLSKYFWQASKHREWLKENAGEFKLSMGGRVKLNLTTTFRAVIRSVVFWWIK